MLSHRKFLLCLLALGLGCKTAGSNVAPARASSVTAARTSSAASGGAATTNSATTSGGSATTGGLHGNELSAERKAELDAELVRGASSSARAPTLRILEVQVEPVYVLGFPMYVGVTFKSDPSASSLRVPLTSWDSTEDAVGVSLRASDQLIYELEPHNQLLEFGSTRLRAGDQRRVLIDLSEVLPSTLRAGTYEAVIALGPPDIQAHSAPVTLRLRAPTPKEKEILRLTAAELEDSRTWGQWTRFPPTGSSPKRQPWGTKDPLRFNWLMRELLYGSAALKHMPLSRLDVLDGIFLPERAALQAELLAQRGDIAALRKHIAAAKRDYPGLSWWLDSIEEGGSVIAWARSHRDE